MTHGADLCQLRINQLDRRQQPITRKSHHAKVRKDIGEIAPPRCEQQHSHDETAESERFHKIASAVGENRQSRVHLRYYRRMLREPVEKMLFSAVDFHRFNPAEHLFRIATQATERYS